MQREDEAVPSRGRTFQLVMTVTAHRDPSWPWWRGRPVSRPSQHAQRLTSGALHERCVQGSAAARWHIYYKNHLNPVFTPGVRVSPGFGYYRLRVANSGFGASQLSQKLPGSSNAVFSGYAVDSGMPHMPGVPFSSLSGSANMRWLFSL